MSRIKGCLGKDGIERYSKIIYEKLDEHGLCSGYGVFFDYNIAKENTVLTIQRYACGVPVTLLLYNEFYCDGEPFLTDNSFEEEFEKHRHKFAA